MEWIPCVMSVDDQIAAEAGLDMVRDP